MVTATAGAAHGGTTDSTVSPDDTTRYVQSGGARTIDVYATGAGGALTPNETVSNVPDVSEGIAVS